MSENRNLYIVNNLSTFSTVLSQYFLISPCSNSSSLRRLLSAQGIITYLADLLMIVCPSISYAFQIIKFKKNRSSKGFSKKICLILLSANILRVFFFLGKKFKVTLLYQSFLIIISQIYLIYLSVKYQEDPLEENSGSPLSQIRLTSSPSKISIFFTRVPFLRNIIEWFSCKNFWNWPKVIDYYKFIALMIVILTLLTKIFGTNNKIYIFIIGSISNFFDAIICLPQIIESFKTKNTSNVSFLMLLSWFLGDGFKLLYNIKYKSPIQMIIGGSTQISLELFTSVLVLCYKNGKISNKTKEKVYSDYVKKLPVAKKKELEEINQLMRSIDELDVSKIRIRNEKNEMRLSGKKNKDDNKQIEMVNIRINNNDNEDKKTSDDEIKGAEEIKSSGNIGNNINTNDDMINSDDIIINKKIV